MSAALRSAAERLRLRYAKHFRVPLEHVEVRYTLDDDDREDAKVWAPDYPAWTVGTVERS